MKKVSVVPTMDEREHTIEFTVTVCKFGKGEQVVYEAQRALERAVRLTFGELGEVHERKH